MNRSSARFLGGAVSLAVLLAIPSPAEAQTPGEVTGVNLDAASLLSWTATPSGTDYNVYRALSSDLAAGVVGRCHADEVATTSHTTAEVPGSGEAYFYIVTAEATDEGTPGVDSAGNPRQTLGLCDDVMRAQMMDRAGYGWDEWTRDRIAALGLTGYLNEQLDPASIDESTNTELNNRLAPIKPPSPLNCASPLYQKVVAGTYARRQLEEQVTVFWDNHFNTDCVKTLIYLDGFYPDCNINPVPWCDATYPVERDDRSGKTETDLYQSFRNLAFNGTFEEMSMRSAKSVEMILYLDTYVNIVGVPNENFAREQLELYNMGVDGGYTQDDVEELSRVWTGWDVCQKDFNDFGDPLQPCHNAWWLSSGRWTGNFTTVNHDCTQKVLFSGTPQETIIPDTCDGEGAPTPNGVDDADLATEAIVAHPSTPKFISTKLLQKLVTENPSQAQVNAVVTEWNDAGNPLGVGDMREVLRSIVTSPGFGDPDSGRDKIKTPLELIVSAFRATRGETDGITDSTSYLVRMSHLPNLNPVPTGFSEFGADWMDTNNLLERQNFVLDVTRRTPSTSPDFASDIIPLLNDNGVSTAPGNSAAIVDFFADVLYGGALTPAERQAAIDFLDTDDTGSPSPYDDARIREAVGFMMGFAQFSEQ